MQRMRLVNDEIRMKSVNPFFGPGAKKCKYSCEGETRQMSTREQLGEKSAENSDVIEGQSTSSAEMQVAGINSTGNSQQEAPNPKHSADSAHYTAAINTWTSTNRPVQPEQGQEQNLATGSYQADNTEVREPLHQQPWFTSPNDLGRRWHNLRRRCYRQQRSQNFSFTVVSYNVLADGLLQSNSYLYNGSEDWLKDWQYRRGNLLKELLHYNADVLCLQEVEMCHYEDWFEPKLREKGYTGVYKKRTGKKTDGCAIFFKESRFTLVKSELVSFNKPNVKLMDRDNVAVVVLLKPKVTGRVNRHANNLVCVSNTHLLFNKKRGDIKLAQLACLFAEIEEIARISPPGEANLTYHPIICCGDFNSTPFSPIYDFVVRGFLDYNGMHRDNFSGQSHFRKSFPPWQGLSNNIIPWELGITTSCIKRNESSQTDENSSNDPEKVDLQPSGSRTVCTGSASCLPASNSEFQLEKSKESTCYSSNCGVAEIHVKNKYLPESPGNHNLGSTQCIPEQDSCIESHSAACGTPLASMQSPTLNSTENEKVSQEGGQSNQHLLAEITEQDVYNASTIQQHNFNFYSVYRHNFKDREPEVTTFHDQVCTTVDYMFVSPGQRQYCRRCRHHHGPLQMTGNLELLTESDLWYLGGLPNKYLSSDHLALVSSFLLHV